MNGFDVNHMMNRTIKYNIDNLIKFPRHLPFINENQFEMDMKEIINKIIYIYFILLLMSENV